MGTAVACTQAADRLIDVFSDDSIVLASKHDSLGSFAEVNLLIIGYL